MSRLKKTAFFLLSLLLLPSFSSCGKNERADANLNILDNNIPTDVATFIYDYFEEFKNGTEGIVKYRHFEDESEVKLLLENDIKILDYEIEKAEKINDNLYAFRLLIQNNGMPKSIIDAGQYMVVYNFVVRIDESLFVCATIRDIPSDLRTGLNPDNYKTNSEIVGNIDGIDVVLPELVG